MRSSHLRFRLTAAIAAGVIAFGPLAGVAQTLPPQTLPPQTLPPLPGLQAPASNAPGAAVAAQGDPPARVGRLAAVQGTVSFHTADQTQWEAATPNYPVTSGNAFWTEPKSEAEIEIGATHVAMNQGTEFDMDRLDDHAMAATEAQGEIYLRLAAQPPGDTTAIATPRGVVTLAQAGRYDIVAGDVDHPTLVTVVEGAAQVTGAGLSLDVGPHQTAAITGTDAFVGTVAAEGADPFLTLQLNRERPTVQGPERGPDMQAPPPMVAQMTGGDALEAVGQWQPTPQYGQVWYPPVQTGWVPYREGHWAWVAPWGWTWVDSAPWGFAPFHYGRWVEIDNRWGWTPGIVAAGYGQPVYAQPVYAPALVSFVDVAAGAAIGLAAGVAIGAAVGWIPLGPREAYYPPYRVTRNYFRDVNITHVTNITNISNVNRRDVTINNFVNRRGATVVPVSAVVGSQPIAARAMAVQNQQFANLRPAAQPPMRPTIATAGVTPGIARQMRLAPPPAGAAPARPTAPGPAFVPRGFPPQGGLPNGGAPSRAFDTPVRAGAPTVPSRGVTPQAGSAGPMRPGQPQPRTPTQPQTPAARPSAPLARPETAARPVEPLRPSEPAGRPAEPAMRAPEPRVVTPRAEPPAAAPRAPEPRPAVQVQRPQAQPQAQPRPQPAPPPRPQAAPRPPPQPPRPQPPRPQPPHPQPPPRPAPHPEPQREERHP